MLGPDVDGTIALASDSSRAHLVGRGVINRGTLTWSRGQLYGADSARIENRGTFEIHDGATLMAHWTGIQPVPDQSWPAGEGRRAGNRRDRVRLRQLGGTVREDSGHFSFTGASVAVPPDSAPEVSFTAPDDEATVDGAVELSADASDPDGIDGVVFLVDGDAVGERDTNAPYRVDWDSTGVDDGAHQLTAVARDLTGTETSAEIDIVVKNAPPLPVPDAPAMSDSTTTALGQATAFLYEGPDAMQTGVEEGVIEPTRVAVLRGRVRAPDGDPLPAVQVSILGHPEFGTTTSRGNGEYSWRSTAAVTLTGGLRAEAISQRPRGRSAVAGLRWVDDVVLTPLDINATELDFDGEGEAVQVAQGSAVTDDDGARTTTLLFAPAPPAECPAHGERSRPRSHGARDRVTVGDGGPDDDARRAPGRPRPTPTPSNPASTRPSPPGPDGPVQPAGRRIH